MRMARSAARVERTKTPAKKQHQADERPQQQGCSSGHHRMHSGGIAHCSLVASVTSGLTAWMAAIVVPYCRQQRMHGG